MERKFGTRARTCSEKDTHGALGTWASGGGPGFEARRGSDEAGQGAEPVKGGRGG